MFHPMLILISLLEFENESLLSSNVIVGWRAKGVCLLYVGDCCSGLSSMTLCAHILSTI